MSVSSARPADLIEYTDLTVPLHARAGEAAKALDASLATLRGSGGGYVPDLGASGTAEDLAAAGVFDDAAVAPGPGRPGRLIDAALPTGPRAQ